VDGSEMSIAALQWALDQGARSGCDVVAVNSWQFPAIADMTGFAVVPDYSMLQEGGRACLDGAVEKVVVPAEVRLATEVVEGPAGPCLVERGAKASLLVVGARGHGGLLSVLLGSVATHCVNHAVVPVVVVPGPTRP
jgi:nucleotide-binding universal stress UspA family protein